MMSALDLGVFESKPFVFVVGEGQVAFTVNSAIIAKQSKALNVLVNGPMIEASNGRASLENVDEDTFARVCQFAFTGDYVTPDFTHIPSIELPQIPDDAKPVSGASEPVMEEEAMPASPVMEPEPEPAIIDEFSWAAAPKKPKKVKKPSKSALLRQLLDDPIHDRETTRATFAARCEVRQNLDPTEDYTRVFLGHAKLYVFAEQWGIDDLKTLALSKLQKTLKSFTLYTVRRPDVVELLRYAFSNEHTPDRVDGTVDELRSLVMIYAACEVEYLVLCPEFLALLGEGGQLAQNLIQMVVKRI